MTKDKKRPLALHPLHGSLPYIDPYTEDPASHFFATGSFLMIKKGCERAEITLKDIDLNRPELLEKRKTRVEEIQKTLNACHRCTNSVVKELLIEELKSEYATDKEYSMFVRSVINSHDYK